MQIQSKEKTIDGVTYKVTQLPATRASLLLRRLVAVLGPSLARALDSMSLSGLKQVFAANVGSLAPALEGLFDRLTEEEFLYLQRQLFSSVLAIENGTAVALDSQNAVDAHFSGRLPAMFQVLYFAIEVNYRDFYSGLGEKLRSLQAPAKGSMSPSSGGSAT